AHYRGAHSTYPCRRSWITARGHGRGAADRGVPPPDIGGVPRSPRLPAAFGEPMRLGNILHVDPDHRLAETAGNLGQHIGVIVEGGGLHDGAGALFGVAGLEDARTHEHP